MIKSTQLINNYQWMFHTCLWEKKLTNLVTQTLNGKEFQTNYQIHTHKAKTKQNKGCVSIYFGGIQIPSTIRPCRGPVRGGEEAHECHILKAFWMNLAEHRFYRLISLFYAPANKANGAKEICKYESNWPVRTTVPQSNGWQWRGEHKQIGFSCHPYTFH